MNIYVDIFMLVLFVAFMIFIFGGYHKTKSEKRERDYKHQEEIKKNLK